MNARPLALLFFRFVQKKAWRAAPYWTLLTVFHLLKISKNNLQNQPFQRTSRKSLNFSDLKIAPSLTANWGEKSSSFLLSIFKISPRNLRSNSKRGAFGYEKFLHFHPLPMPLNALKDTKCRKIENFMLKNFADWKKTPTFAPDLKHPKAVQPPVPRKKEPKALQRKPCTP